MEIREKIELLYGKDTSKAYGVLKELEALSDREDSLYPFLDEFISMLDSDRYAVRVRGFRLLCKQAKWDSENRIDGAIGSVLAVLHDEKPTAVRQALQYLETVVPYKKALGGKIREAVLGIDAASYQDTMRPLIEKDIRRLVKVIDENSENERRT